MVVCELTVGVAFLGGGIELFEAGLNPGLGGIAESDRRIEYKIIKVQCLIARILESFLGFYQRIRAGSYHTVKNFKDFYPYQTTVYHTLFLKHFANIT